MENIFIHDTAIIDKGAIIGEGTKIWHFCHVMSKAQIGKNCVLGQNVFVGDKVILGNNVKIQNNVSIYEGVYCEDEVFIGPSVVFTNVLNPRSSINRKLEYKPTFIKKGTSIGANATIVCGITLNEFCFIGAGTVITKDVPAYALIVGNPGKLIGWMSEAGEKLTFDNNGKATCPLTNKTYSFNNGLVKKLQ